MAVESRFLVPDGGSFEAAIALTQALLDGMERGQVSNSQVGQTVGDLVQTETGVRGFFVAYLNDDRSLVDQPTPEVIAALQTAAAVVAPFLVKNLAMSTAMAIAHRRNQNQDLAQGSDRVRSRSAQLIQTLQLPQLREHGYRLASSIQLGTGDYQSFLERWGYDTEQKQAIYAALEQVGLA